LSEFGLGYARGTEPKMGNEMELLKMNMTPSPFFLLLWGNPSTPSIASKTPKLSAVIKNGNGRDNAQNIYWAKTNWRINGSNLEEQAENNDKLNYL
jgi:hypothetical protein